MLKLVNVSKIYQTDAVQTTALDQVTLEIEAGEYVAVTGPSGCGKSTLLGLLGLLDTPSSGAYWFDGKNIAGLNERQLGAVRRGRIGFIFQSFNLLEDLTVFENVELALEYVNPSSASRAERVNSLLERLGVGHRKTHYPSQLSGGQQQRVAIARALAASPALLLADEPTGNLDTSHGDEVMKILRSINAEGTTVVMVTHSPLHAAQASRTINLLDGRVLIDALHSS